MNNILKNIKKTIKEKLNGAVIGLTEIYKELYVYDDNRFELIVGLQRDFNKVSRPLALDVLVYDIKYDECFSFTTRLKDQKSVLQNKINIVDKKDIKNYEEMAAMEIGRLYNSSINRCKGEEVKIYDK